MKITILRLEANAEISFFTSKKSSGVIQSTEALVELSRKTKQLFYVDESSELFYNLVNVLGQEATVSYSGGKIVKIKTKFTEFRDVQAILPVSIEVISELHNYVSTFRDLYGASLTLSGAAYKQLKQYGYDVKNSKTRFNFDSRFRPYYFGGRCEYAQTGEVKGDDLVAYDINSAYPAAMMKKHWYGEDCTCSNDEADIVEQSMIEVTCVSLGALAIRDEEGRITFPKDGRRTYKTTGWEYLTAKKLNLLSDIKIHLIYSPKHTADFTQFVNHFYLLKKNAKNELEKVFAKLILNSVYGKFAQDPRKFENTLLLEEGKFANGWKLSGSLETGDANSVDIWKKKKYTTEQLKEITFNNVATACSITGCVRAELMIARFTCKNFQYCDTDSIICERNSALTVGNLLGEWKIEAEVKQMFIGGKKLYALESKEGKWKTASKGVRLTAEQIIEVCAGKEIQYTFDKLAHSIVHGKRKITRNIKMT